MAAFLRESNVPFALIGAAALAVHGVTRSTRDLDLLTVTAACLEPATWHILRRGDVDVSIRKGDADDPLAGVVRIGARGEHPLDLVVGKHPWQSAIVRRAREATIEGTRVPVAGRADLVLLKLYAGGPQDAWDITQLLDVPDSAALAREIETGLAALPPESRALWQRIRTSGS